MTTLADRMRRSIVDTCCPHCSARVRSRVWVDDAPALFVETYECGSALAYGVVEKSRQTIRDCVNPLD